MHDLIESQLGLLSRHQALAAGLSERQIDWRIGSGEWDPIYPAVYRRRGVPLTDDVRLLGAVLAAGDGAAASHRSAAIRQGTRTIGGNILEISVPSTARPKLAGVVVHRMRDLVPEEIHTLRSIPITRPERTLIDLGMVVGRPTLGRLMEEWLADRVVTIEGLRRGLERHGGKGRRGVGVARDVLETRALGDEVGDSTDEHLVASVLVAYGCPAPVHHHLVRRNGRVLAELDWAYVAERVGVELLGYQPHTRSRQAFETFLARQNLLLGEGWYLLGYTPAMLRRRPWAVAREIDDARRARAQA